MAVYLGSKRINPIYNIILPTSLDTFLNRTVTKYSEEDLVGLESLKDNAFYYQSAITSITFPNTLKSIGNTPFLGCSKLTTVRFTSAEPPALGTRPFPTGNTFRTIYVPKGSLEAYQNAYGFSDFASKIREW